MKKLSQLSFMFMLTLMLVTSCEQVETIDVNGEQEVQVECQDCSAPLPAPEGDSNSSGDSDSNDQVGGGSSNGGSSNGGSSGSSGSDSDSSSEMCIALAASNSISADCTEARIQLYSCENGSKEESRLDLPMNTQMSAQLCPNQNFRCQSWTLIDQDRENLVNVFECDEIVNLIEANRSDEEKIAINLYRDFLARDPSEAEKDQLAEALEANRYNAILAFLREDQVVRRRMADWRKEIWYDDESIAELAQSNKINRLRSGYGNGTNSYELIAREYYDRAYWDPTHLASLRQKLNIQIPFGVLVNDYTWVYVLYPGLHQKLADSQGRRFYSQIANNISKRQMTYTIMNHNGGETHFSTAAKWYKRYLKRSETIAELKGTLEVQTFTQNNLSNNNFRDVRALARLLDSRAYLQTYQAMEE